MMASGPGLDVAKQAHDTTSIVFPRWYEVFKLECSFRLQLYRTIENSIGFTSNTVYKTIDHQSLLHFTRTCYFLNSVS